MKKSFFFIAFIICGTSVDAQQNSLLPLKVSEDRHFLQYENGKPFFWLADTGWNLFNSLTKEEMIKYFDNRKAKGFNVIQCVVVAEEENRYGRLPFINMNPAQQDEQYFQLIDWSIKEAAKRNLYIAFLPTWGHSVAPLWDESNKAIFNISNAYAYGYFLGKRYKNENNIVWVSGGDRPAYNDTADWRPVYKSMIKGLKDGGAKQLVTYHPAGESSSTQFWNCENVLDFNMLQSGHRMHDLPVWEWIKRDRAYKPYRPIIDSEPNYERHPVNWDPENGYFTSYDVRKQLYRSVFSGASGVTYGHHSIWQFYYQGKKNIAHAVKYWHEALNDSAAFHAGYLHRLIASRPFGDRIPVWEMVQNSPTELARYITPFLHQDKSYAMIYIPVGQTIKIDPKYINGKSIAAWWFDPRTNSSKKIGIFKTGPILTFTTPSTGFNNDWVLVLDDASKNYKNPANK